MASIALALLALPATLARARPAPSSEPCGAVGGKGCLRGTETVLTEAQTGQLRKLSAGNSTTASPAPAVGPNTTAQPGTPGECSFMVPPTAPYFWDPACREPTEDPLGGLGCLADGLHWECRYCGDAPYTSISCPRDAGRPYWGHCKFEPGLQEPVTVYYWDSSCVAAGGLGCNADGKHVECRYCGGQGAYKDVPCPSCMFPAPPTIPYFWDNDCRRHGGGLGCRADGVNDECRFCGARPFESVRCPESVIPSNGSCYFPVEPRVGYYWEGTGKCKLGVKGCHADGIHMQCRFCGGEGDYSDIPCPP
mmetsp:Transcript_106530/g.301271  ORF Transcript_106530/g.301271 Transcript_106530/m.301271 type:complete len:307 (-) Transcript_106530:287-1207(-)